MRAAFRRWLDESGAELISLERQVADLTLGYGGTFDILANVDGALTLIDVKTWKRAADAGRRHVQRNRHAARSLRPRCVHRRTRRPEAVPDAEGRSVCRPAPATGHQYDTGYQVYPFDVTDREFAAFCGLLEVYRWQQERAKLVIREPKILVRETAA